MNAKMPALRRAFERAGFSEVKTILSSGNVAFDARAASEATLERKAEAAMKAALGTPFHTIVRSSASLKKMLAADPYRRFRLPPKAKRVVTFMRKPAKGRLPAEYDGARMLVKGGREVFTAYVPTGRGAAFMVLIEKTFGKEVTTRTWDTVKKCAAA